MNIRRVKTAMAEKGMNQKELAEAIGTSQAAISRYFKEQRIPSTPLLIKMADALDVSVDYILGRTDEVTRPVTLIVAKQFGDFMAFKTVAARINNVEVDGTVVGVEL